MGKNTCGIEQASKIVFCILLMFIFCRADAFLKKPKASSSDTQSPESSVCKHAGGTTPDEYACAAENMENENKRSAQLEADGRKKWTAVTDAAVRKLKSLAGDYANADAACNPFLGGTGARAFREDSMTEAMKGSYSDQIEFMETLPLEPVADEKLSALDDELNAEYKRVLKSSEDRLNELHEPMTEVAKKGIATEQGLQRMSERKWLKVRDQLVIVYQSRFATKMSRIDLKKLATYRITKARIETLKGYKTFY